MPSDRREGHFLQHAAIVIGRALLCGLALAGAPGLAQAQSTQNWPQHTVRMITPLGPGSGMDVAARLFAERLSQKWGQPVVVGLILGPVAESQLRRALQISLGDPMVLLQSPMSATLLGVALLALIAPFALKGLDRFKASED